LLSYDLFRIGRIIRNTGIEAANILKLVSDINNAKARNFLSKVITIEIDQRKKNFEQTKIAALPLRECGNWMQGTRKKDVFVPDVNQALAFPFIIPSGGNPLHPQGIYPVPAYPVYDRHFKNFLENKNSITQFLIGRMEITINVNLDDIEIEQIADCIYKSLSNMELIGKTLGLIILAVITENGPYYLTESTPPTGNNLVLGNSYTQTGKIIVADAAAFLTNFWNAKFAEGKAGGQKKKGICSICQKHEPVVSAYNKALYWLPTTWEAPLSFGREKTLVDSIALCINCYADLTLGASVFGKISNNVDYMLSKEIFAPVASPIGKEYALWGEFKDAIQGSMLALPLDDSILEDDELADEWVCSLYDLLGEELPTGLITKKESAKSRHLKNITGLETRLPEEWENEDFRLTLTYFSGDPGKLNIHLRAVINDILPATASNLQEICTDVGAEMQEIIDSHTFLGEKSAARKYRQTSNLLYLLSAAFGPPYLWGCLEKTFKKEPLAKNLFYKNSAARMTQLGKMLPDSIFDLQQEAIDYLAINMFLEIYTNQLANITGGDESMKTVNELIKATWETPVEEIRFASLDELGFAAGQVVQRFGNSYYQGANKKDYIKHRIMTFGTSLTPEVVHYKALGRMEEYTAMLKLGVSSDVLKRAAVISMGFVQFEDEIKKNKDRFMAAFWAGYSLGRKKKETESKSDMEDDN
jgi:hypothetical protein